MKNSDPPLKSEMNEITLRNVVFFLFGRRNILRVSKRERNFQANRFIERVFAIVLIPHFDCGKLSMPIERAFSLFHSPFQHRIFEPKLTGRK